MVAFLLLAGGALLGSVQAMDGSGSPRELDVVGGHPVALLNPTGATAVFYPPPVSNCMASPSCIPFPPLSTSSPWFSTPPGPVSNGFRTPNPCPPAQPAWILFPGGPQWDPTPFKNSWSPIESLTNLHTASPAKFVANNSIAFTPFNPPTYNPPTYPLNTYNPGLVNGQGRFHLDNQYLVSPIESQVGTNIFTANGNPHDAENAPDNMFVLLGDDGYMLGRFDTPVVDGPGYDFYVNTIMQQPFGTYCMYGATQPTGPFTLVHSAFTDFSACDPLTSAYCPTLPPGSPPCPGGYCFPFDLHFFYTPLRTLCGNPCTGGLPAGQMDYFLVLNTIRHTPYLKTDFVVDRDNALLCPVTCPDMAWYPVPLRTYAWFNFTDTSVRFGYPLWGMWDENQGMVVPDPTLNFADPISQWDWDFSSDRWNREAPARSNTSNERNTQHRYISPGMFPVCHSVHTTDQWVPRPPDLQGNPQPPAFAVRRQSDPPASDFPLANPPPFGLLPYGRPDPANMYCRYVTVWNLPPIPDSQHGPESSSSVEIRFKDTSVDPDWLMPDLDCPECPPDGIQTRTWDFQSDGIVDYSWTFTGVPYNPATDDPVHTYPRPGDYYATHQVCDHDMIITTTPPIYGGLAAIYGDPLGPAHACATERVLVRIGNVPPYVRAPIAIAVRANARVEFVVSAMDPDPGQSLTLRLCPPPANQGLPSGMVFEQVFEPGGQYAQQVFRWDTGLAPRGRYGPVCFEATDGNSTTHSLTMIWIASETQDTDLDGVPDVADNCPTVANADQADWDRDGVGDACSEGAPNIDVTPKAVLFDRSGRLDSDGDGIPDEADVCPFVPDAAQRDTDGDGVGDACDLDVDGDGVPNGEDTCPLIPNPRQGGVQQDACRSLPPVSQPVALPAEVPQVSAQHGAWRIVGGSLLALVALVGVLVPLVRFALRKGEGK
jgi:hypothetical protein